MPYVSINKSFFNKSYEEAQYYYSEIHRKNIQVAQKLR